MTKQANTKPTIAAEKKRPTRKHSKVVEIGEQMTSLDTESDTFEDNETDIVSMPKSRTQSKIGFVVLLAIIIIGFIGYKYQYFFVPATINGKPILITEYIRGLHQSFGKDYLNTLTTQKAIEQEIGNSGVKVESVDIDKEVDRIDKQASSSGGIKALLDAQQTSMSELRNQIRIQLAVKKILKDKLIVSEAEVDDSYKKNKDFFKGKSEAEAKITIYEQLEGQKFQTEAQAWLADLKKKTTIKIMFPGMQLEGN